MPYHHGDLRRALLEGALELLAEGGPSHLTLRAAARRAGVSVAAPYRHFEDKRALLAAVAEDGFLALQRASEEAVERGGQDPIERFYHHGMAYVRFAVENPAQYRVMFGPELADKRIHEDLYRAARAAFDGLRATLSACADAGLFSSDDIELRAMRAWALVHGLASLYLDGQLNVDEDVSKEAFLARVGEVFRLDPVPVESASSAPGGLPRRRKPAV